MKRIIVPILLLFTVIMSIFFLGAIAGNDNVSNKDSFIDTGNWNYYINDGFGLEFKYPLESNIEIRTEKEEFTARLNFPVEPGTLLSEKFMVINVTSSHEYAEKSGRETEAEDKSSSTVNVNGKEFTMWVDVEGAAGSTYETINYRTKQYGLNYKLKFVFRSANPGSYGSNPPPGFSREKEGLIFAEVLSSFHINSLK